LDDGKAADFVRAVSQVYTLATLHRLMAGGGRFTRRAAALAVTLLGRAESVPQVGQALRDPDRAVRLIAEDGIQAIWDRGGDFEQCQQLQMIMRLNAAGQYAAAIALADRILEQAPDFGQVWFERAEALLAQGEYFAAIADYRRVLACESFHFPAALSMARCYLELGDPWAALQGLQHTLSIHPHLEFARAQLSRLRRELREQID
jgi:tetratricopeptide (TPR) repeat protein